MVKNARHLAAAGPESVEREKGGSLGLRLGSVTGGEEVWGHGF